MKNPVSGNPATVARRRQSRAGRRGRPTSSMRSARSAGGFRPAFRPRPTAARDRGRRGPSRGRFRKRRGRRRRGAGGRGRRPAAKRSAAAKTPAVATTSGSGRKNASYGPTYPAARKQAGGEERRHPEDRVGDRRKDPRGLPGAERAEKPQAAASRIAGGTTRTSGGQSDRDPARAAGGRGQQNRGRARTAIVIASTAVEATRRPDAATREAARTRRRETPRRRERQGGEQQLGQSQGRPVETRVRAVDVPKGRRRIDQAEPAVARSASATAMPRDRSRNRPPPPRWGPRRAPRAAGSPSCGERENQGAREAELRPGEERREHAGSGGGVARGESLPTREARAAVSAVTASATSKLNGKSQPPGRRNTARATASDTARAARNGGSRRLDAED